MRTRGGLPVRRWRERILALRLGLLLIVALPAPYWGWLPAAVAVAVAAVLIWSLVPQRLGSAVAAGRTELVRLERRVARADRWAKDRHVAHFWRRHAAYAALVGRRDPAERERLLLAAMAEGSMPAFSALVEERRERDLTGLIDRAYRARPGLGSAYLEVLLYKDLPEHALQLARRMLADGWGEAQHHVVRLLLHRGRLDDAVAVWRSHPVRHGYPSAAVDLGSALRAAGRPGEAFEVLWTEYDRTGHIFSELPGLAAELGRADEVERRWLADVGGRDGAWVRSALRSLYLATGRPADADAIAPPPPPRRRSTAPPEPPDDRDYFSPFLEW